MNKEFKNDIQLVKARENSSEAFQAPEQSLNLVSFFVHVPVVFPNTQAIAFRGNNRNHTEIKNQLARLIALIGFVHDDLSAFPAAVFKAFQQFSPFGSVAGLPRRQRKCYSAVVTGCNQMNFGGPTSPRLAERLRTVFFKAPVPSGWTLTAVESRYT